MQKQIGARLQKTGNFVAMAAGLCPAKLPAVRRPRGQGGSSAGGRGGRGEVRDLLTGDGCVTTATNRKPGRRGSARPVVAQLWRRGGFGPVAGWWLCSAGPAARSPPSRRRTAASTRRRGFCPAAAEAVALRACKATRHGAGVAARGGGVAARCRGARAGGARRGCGPAPSYRARGPRTPWRARRERRRRRRLRGSGGWAGPERAESGPWARPRRIRV